MIRTDEEWKNWGYDTKEACYICGTTDNTKLEPRFYYSVCIEHSNIPPTYLDDYKNKMSAAEVGESIKNILRKIKE